MEKSKALLRSLPKVDECLLLLEPYLEARGIALSLAKKAVQQTIGEVRERILAGEFDHLPESRDDWHERFTANIERLWAYRYRRVINGTGIIIHTNLGRSLLSCQALEQLTMGASRYTNLEYDLDAGKRGSRYSLVEQLICELTGAESALVVNNNAAAVLIALETLARNREVIVSRGQLVEIGGSFRIPEVMEKSGACLVEVGATNRTHRYDYERAVSDHTALLLKVHSSNFRMVGFTSEVSAEELVDIGREHRLPVMEDLGSGSLIDMSPFGVPGEPTVQEVVKAGVDVVTFSGDKLLGGPQAGVIVGKREYLDRIKKNPLNRALRIDKFTLAALESTLRSYYDLERALRDIPTLRMISEPAAEIKKRVRKCLRRIDQETRDVFGISVVPAHSRVGGGSLPEYALPSWALELRPLRLQLNVLERRFRKLPVPLIGRIEHDRFLIDFRTIQDHEIAELADVLTSFFKAEPIHASG